MCSSDLFLGLLAILFPPIAVWVKCGICSADSLINILLCMLGYLPGLLHSWYIIAKYPENDYDYIPDSEARVTYVVVQPNSGHHRQPQYAPKPNTRTANQPSNNGYGTTTAPPVQQDQSGAWTQPAANVSGEGSSGGAVPPTYEQAIRGDHKVQTRD